MTTVRIGGGSRTGAAAFSFMPPADHANPTNPMCSILAVLDTPAAPALERAGALARSALQRHRGPDWSGVAEVGRNLLVHERLAIVGLDHGAQPLVDPDTGTALAVNGEIYNHAELRGGLTRPYPFATASDCEVILALYREHGRALVERLSGIYAFVLVDGRTGEALVARDALGVVPLYWGVDGRGVRHVASEMKALAPVCTAFEVFPPGHIWQSGDAAPKRFYRRAWQSPETLRPEPADPERLADALERAVAAQLMADVPFGALLSGGLDSSLIAALAARHQPGLRTFCVGLEGSPDLERAREVADHIGSHHEGFTFTVAEGLDALRDVVWHLETYDVTTIRAGTPMFLMARRIRSRGVKMVLSGEGADEVFGGYLYFHHAPNGRALHEETVRKLERLHLYDCLRANKAMAAWGVEARVPFLDTTFLDVAMSMDPAAKLPAGGIEKRLLREALGHRLPEAVAWRQKEQFSDGVGYGWIDALKEHAARLVDDADLAAAPERFAVNPPTTAEAYLYRTLFDELFPGRAAAATVPGGPSVACSTPEALAWATELSAEIDPSGRAVRGVHGAGLPCTVLAPRVTRDALG